MPLMRNEHTPINGNCKVETEAIQIGDFGTFEIERLKQVTAGDRAVAAFMNTVALLSMIDREIVAETPEEDMGKLPRGGIVGVRDLATRLHGVRSAVANLEEPLTNTETVELFRTIYPDAAVRQKDVIKSQPQLDDQTRLIKAVDLLELFDGKDAIDLENEISDLYGPDPRVMVLSLNGHATTLVKVGDNKYIHIDPMKDTYEFLNTDTAMRLLKHVDDASSNFCFLLQKSQNHRTQSSRTKSII